MLRNSASAVEELLQFLYLTPVGIVKFDGDGVVDLINPAASRLLLALLPKGDLTNLYDSVLPHFSELRRFVEQFTSTAGVVVEGQRLEVRAGSTTLVMSLTVERINETVYMAVIEDVSANVRAERKLLADQQRFRAIFDNVRDYAIFTVTLQGSIEEWNRSLERFGGWSASDVEGRHLGMLFPNDDPDSSNAAALLADAELRGSIETEGWLHRRDGSRLWGNMVITALPTESGAVRGFAIVARDMTERKRAEDDLQQLATVDALTGAFNRRHGHACLTAELERLSRSAQPFAVLMLDIDWFKSINDTYGHEAGDTVLSTMVLACSSQLRLLDILVRWGGEEFLIVLPGTNAEGAVIVAERLRESLAALPIPLGAGRSVQLTVSIGVAGAAAGDDLAGLLRRADKGLYAAKAGGRNQVALAA